MAGVSQFACVQLYMFHSFFLIVFFPYTEDDPQSQHLVVRPTVCSTHCSSCTTNVHLIPASGYDEVYHMPMSRAGMRPGGLVCILLFEHGVWSLSDRTQCIMPIEARCWNYISLSHTCPRLRATCHYSFHPCIEVSYQQELVGTRDVSEFTL